MRLVEFYIKVVTCSQTTETEWPKTKRKKKSTLLRKNPPKSPRPHHQHDKQQKTPEIMNKVTRYGNDEMRVKKKRHTSILGVKRGGSEREIQATALLSISAPLLLLRTSRKG